MGAVEPPTPPLRSKFVTRCTAILGSALLLVACSSPGTAKLTPSVTPDLAGGSPQAQTVLAVFLAPVQGSTTKYQISLVGTDGSVAASVQATRRTNLPGTPLPYVAASSSRVYFLDGDAHLKSMSPNGKVVAVRDISGATGQVHAAFAVSPDDRQLAYSTIDYTTVPPLLRLSVASLANGGQSKEIFSSSSLYVWPVGWHEGKLVVAVGDAYPTGPAPDGAAHPWCDPSFGACTADNPYSATQGYHVVDPADATRLASLGSSQCRVIGLLTGAGTICKEGRSGPSNPVCNPAITLCLRLVSWQAAITDWTSTGSIWTGEINPSASQLVACCQGGSMSLYTGHFPGGDERVLLRQGGMPVWWMDEEHLIYQPLSGQPATIMHILTVSSGDDVVVKAAGFPVASVPSGF